MTVGTMTRGSAGSPQARGFGHRAPIRALHGDEYARARVEIGREAPEGDPKRRVRGLRIRGVLHQVPESTPSGKAAEIQSGDKKVGSD